MDKMKPQWHRDRVEELKIKLTNHKWKASVLVTSLIGIASLTFIIWYNQPVAHVRIILVILGIVFLISTEQFNYLFFNHCSISLLLYSLGSRLVIITLLSRPNPFNLFFIFTAFFALSLSSQT